MSMLGLDSFASDGLEWMVPLAAIFFVFGLPVLAFVFFRMMAHRERMAMIRNGLSPGPLGFRGRRSGFGGAEERRPAASGFDDGAYAREDAQCALRKGIKLTFVGFALTLGLSFIGYHTETLPLPGMSPVTTWHPGPWLLGGLIPLFVGLAQVAIALLSGATLGPAPAAQHPPYDGAPRESYGTDAPAAPSYDRSYTYRPGDTPELRPPAPPRAQG